MPTDPLVASAIKEQTAMQLAQFTKELAAMGELAVIAGIIDTSIGGTASGVPYSVKNSLYNASVKLADINATLDKIVDNQTEITSSLKDLIFALNAQIDLNKQNLQLQQLAVLDQLKNNAKTQSEADAALKRAGIEPQPAVDVKTLVKNSVSDVGLMKSVTEFTSSLSDITGNLITNTMNWIKSTGPYRYAEDALKQAFENVAILKSVKALFKPTAVANAAIAAKNNTAIAAGLPAMGGTAIPDTTAY